MPWYDSLIEQGAVPGGTRPKTINPTTGKTEYAPENRVASFMKGLQTYEQQQSEVIKQRDDKIKRHAEMYNVLREAGYDPKGAYEAVQKGSFPGAAPSGTSIKTQQEEATLAKTKADTLKSEADRAKTMKETAGVGTFNKDLFEAAGKLRDDYRASPAFKNFQEVERAEKNIASAYAKSIDPANPSRIASDQALGVSIQKMLDPGSVVREGEFARTQQGASLINQLYGTATQLVSGGMKITDQDRAAIKQMADLILQNSKGSLQLEVDTFGHMADEVGVPRDLIFGKQAIAPTEPPPGMGQPEPTFMTETEAEAANLPKGTVVNINGRRARVQ